MYQGNPDLRKTNEVIEYEPWMIDEIIKCSEDIIYFAEKYFTIINIDTGKQLIELYDFQKKMLKAFINPPNNKRHCIVKASRQCGKCVQEDSIVKIRNKKTGEIKEISLGEFYKQVKT